jgi:hypothetical protein
MNRLTLEQKGYTSLGYLNGMSDEKRKDLRSDKYSFRRVWVSGTGNQELFADHDKKVYYQVDCS